MKYSQFCSIVQAMIAQGCDPDPELEVHGTSYSDGHYEDTFEPVDNLSVDFDAKTVTIWT